MAKEQRPPNHRLQQLREQRGLTVRDLAQLVGYDHLKIYRLESGETRMDLDTMRHIAQRLGVKASDLLLEEDVGLRPDRNGEEVLEALRGIDEDDLPDVITAARTIVRTARTIAASGKVLTGDAEEVRELAEAWNDFKPADRARALDLWRASGLRR